MTRPAGRITRDVPNLTGRVGLGSGGVLEISRVGSGRVKMCLNLTGRGRVGVGSTLTGFDPREGSHSTCENLSCF